jgi:hypothetical protein
LPSQSPGLADFYSVSDDAQILQHRGWRQFWALVVPPIGGKENDLSPSQSILAIARIAFVAVLIFIACVMVVKMSFIALT